MGFLESLLGSSVVAGWLRAAVLGAVATAVQKQILPGSVDYGSLIDTLAAVFVGLWSHVAKTSDPSVKTTLPAKAAAAAIAAPTKNAAKVAVAGAPSSDQF